MKIIFSTFLFVFNFVSLNSFTADANIQGVWSLTNSIATKTGPLTLELSIFENQMSLKATCQFQEQSGENVAPETLSTSLTTAIEFSGSEIKILEEKTSNAENGIKSCRSYVAPTTWNYTLSEDGNQLTIDAIIPYMQRLDFLRK